MPFVDLDALLPGGSASTGDQIPATWAAGVASNFGLVDPWGQWTDYTPTIAQGVTTDIAKTVNRARWMRVGRKVKVEVHVTMTAAGTAGDPITISAPVTVATLSPANAILGAGSGYFNDTGTAQYSVNVVQVGGNNTTVRMLRCDATFTNYVGADPSMEIASGDIIGIEFEYEAAADA